MKILHYKFNVVTMDKAIDNIAFVYQIHYGQVLINEVDLNNSSNKVQIHMRGN